MNTREYSKERFNNLTEWDENKFNLKKVFRLIGKYCPQGNFRSLLDIGCADGSFAMMIGTRYDYNLFGIDICKKPIIEARKKGVMAITQNIEKEKLPYKNNTFNIIIMCEVLEHIFDTDFLIKEIYRVLKPNGYLFITVPNVASFTSRIKLLFGGYPNGVEYNVGKKTNGHIRAYTPNIIKKQLKNNGFKIIKCTSPNLLFPVKNNKIPMFIRDSMINLSDLTANLGEQIVGVFRK